jgi:hypothetical protein
MLVYSDCIVQALPIVIFIFQARSTIFPLPSIPYASIGLILFHLPSPARRDGLPSSIYLLCISWLAWSDSVAFCKEASLWDSVTSCKESRCLRNASCTDSVCMLYL